MPCESKQTPAHPKNASGFKRLPRATYLSLKGFRAVWQFESGFRQEVAVSLILLIASVILAQSILQWLLLVVPLFIVLITEILNSAIEAVADAITLDDHPLIGRAKDMGSAAVFLSLLLVVLVWTSMIYYNYFG